MQSLFRETRADETDSAMLQKQTFRLREAQSWLQESL
jgi:hypothetical protein